LDNLSRLGVTKITLCVGYQRERVREYLASRTSIDVETIDNEAYAEGSIVSLWTVRSALCAGDDVIVMDADVLYDPRMLDLLYSGPGQNVLLCDRDFAAGEEPVKICLAGGRIVEFRKRIAAGLDFDDCGESVGFFKFEPAMAVRLAERTEHYVETGQRDAPHEEAIRDLALEYPREFRVADATGVPWIEIDFPADIVRAETQILPHIEPTGHD
jgi:choline kinase